MRSELAVPNDRSPHALLEDGERVKVCARVDVYIENLIISIDTNMSTHFNVSKYTRWYDSIITRARARSKLSIYVERHHIIPKCMGGLNGDNLVELTPREHFICHRLLVRMTDDLKTKKALRWALHRMMFSKADTHESRYVTNSHTFAKLRDEFNEAQRKPRELSEDHRAKIIAANQSRKGRKLSDETRAKMSAARMGRTSPNKGKARPEEAIQKMKATMAAQPKKAPWNKGKQASAEDRKKIADGLKQSEQFQTTKHNRKGCTLTEETRAKMSAARTGKPLTEAHKQAIRDGARHSPSRPCCASIS